MVGKFVSAIFLICVLGILDLVWMNRFGSLSVTGFQERIYIILQVISPGVLLALVACIPRYKFMTQKLFYGEVSWVFLWITLFAVSTTVLAIFTYLSTAVSGALIDRQLLDFDTSIGFDWLAARQWLIEHSLLKYILNLSYRSFILQLLVIIIVLVFRKRQGDLYALFLFFVISALLCSVVSIYFPANSLFTVFNVGGKEASSISHFALLRNKTDLSIDVSGFQGLISFPSFHTMLAIGFVYAIRNVTVMLVPFFILNFLMILSTPIDGGHYLLDVIAGIFLAFFVIWIVEKMRPASEL